MGLLKYSEHDLRGLLSRVIHVRWPAEKLLILTPCHMVGPDKDLPTVLDETSSGPSVARPDVPPERGFLAATQSRLIFHEEVTAGLLVRAISVVVGFLSLAVLFLGDGVGTFLPMAAVALVLWGIAKVLEMLLAGKAEIEFDRVGHLDPFSQRIEGMTRNGTRYRLGVPDPSDFLLVVALVEGRAAA